MAVAVSAIADAVVSIGVVGAVEVYAYAVALSVLVVSALAVSTVFAVYVDAVAVVVVVAVAAADVVAVDVDSYVRQRVWMRSASVDYRHAGRLDAAVVWRCAIDSVAADATMLHEAAKSVVPPPDVHSVPV